ncbi:MAG: LVIVD repeat-containing protein [Planctomycetota bacterium]
MNRFRLLLILHFVLAGSGVPAALAGHTVLSGVDLYPYNAQRSGNVYYYKGTVFVSADGAGVQSPYTLVYSVDVSDPYNISYRSSSGEGSKAKGLKAVDDKLYVAYWTHALLRVFDISSAGVISPSYWQVADSSDPAAWKLDVSNKRAYVVASESGHVNGVRIIDVSVDNPPDPIISIVPPQTDRNTGSIVVRGSYAYYTDGNKFRIANISDENNPYALTSIDLGQLLTGVVLRDDLAYIHCHDNEPNSFYVYNISNPVSPSFVGQYAAGGVNVMYLLGDYAFLTASILHTVNISNPASPSAVCNTDVPLSSDEYGPANKAWECSVTGNGHYLYVGVSENYPKEEAGVDPPPIRPDNYTRGKLFAVDAIDVLGQDPDDIGPEEWGDLSLGETFRHTRYECDDMPTAADPAWQVFEGSEVWASVTDGILRINDTGTASGDKIKLWRNWNATNSYGATVLVRAKCDFYDIGGGSISYLNNIFIEDGKYKEHFAILSDRIRATEANLEYDNGGLFDGTLWHTYRITTQGSTFNVYLDEDPVPVMTGALSTTTNRARIMLGSGSSAGTQDIYFDYLYTFPNGTYSSLPVMNDPTPSVSVKAADTSGKGSLSGIVPSSVQLYWSTDGGETWNQSGVGGPVEVTCSGDPGDYDGIITALQIPFHQSTYTENKLRFSLQDVAGNVGFSPIYNVRTNLPGAPSPVTNFTATPGYGKIILSWTNPGDPQFDGTLVRYRTDGYPSDPADGTLVVDKINTPGSNDSYEHHVPQTMLTYYYAAFAHDGIPNYSPAETAFAVPDIPGDTDGDEDVDQEDFGRFQACLSGDGVLYEEGCEYADLDTDLDVDGDDFIIFNGCMGGPNNPPEC